MFHGRPPLQQAKDQQRAKHGSGVIQSTLEGKHALVSVHQCLMQSTRPRCGTKTLAHPIQESQHQHPTPTQSKADQRPGGIGNCVATHNKFFGIPATVCQPAGNQLENTGCCLGQTFYQTHDGRTSA